MVNYKDVGLVNTREMFKRAVAGGYAIPAFNFNTMEQMQAIGNLIANPGMVAYWVYAIGAVLFTASDIILIFNTFGGGDPKFSMRIGNLSLYYAGQILIALSLQFLK